MRMLNEVNPNHYRFLLKDGSELESIDFLQAVLGDDGFRWFCVGNCLKYLVRHDRKHKEFLTDIKKALRMLEFAVNHLEGKVASCSDSKARLDDLFRENPVDTLNELLRNIYVGD